MVHDSHRLTILCSQFMAYRNLQPRLLARASGGLEHAPTHGQYRERGG